VLIYDQGIARTGCLSIWVTDDASFVDLMLNDICVYDFCHVGGSAC